MSNPPAYPKSCCRGVIYEDESIPNMSYLLQGPEHPNPGMPYTARGFPRYCYLPDNEKGRKVRHRADSVALIRLASGPCAGGFARCLL